jgi:hypothetical protein
MGSPMPIGTGIFKSEGPPLGPRRCATLTADSSADRLADAPASYLLPHRPTQGVAVAMDRAELAAARAAHEEVAFVPAPRAALCRAGSPLRPHLRQDWVCCTVPRRTAQSRREPSGAAGLVPCQGGRDPPPHPPSSPTLLPSPVAPRLRTTRTRLYTRTSKRIQPARAPTHAHTIRTQPHALARTGRIHFSFGAQPESDGSPCDRDSGHREQLRSPALFAPNSSRRFERSPAQWERLARSGTPPANLSMLTAT